MTRPSSFRVSPHRGTPYPVCTTCRRSIQSACHPVTDTLNGRGKGGAVIIEFAGPSCAGKSTLIGEMDVALRRTGTRCRIENGRAGSRRHRLLALSDPRLFAWSLLNLFLLLRADSRRKVLNLFNAIGCAKRLAKDESMVVLLDEGPFKACQGEYLRTMRFGTRLVAAAIPTPSMIVWVTCDPEIRVVRLRRFRPRSKHLRHSEVLKADGEKEGIVRRVAEAKGLEIFEVDATPGSPQPEELVRALRGKLRSLEGQSGAPE